MLRVRKFQLKLFLRLVIGAVTCCLSLATFSVVDTGQVRAISNLCPTVLKNGIRANPSVALVDGTIRGNFNARSNACKQLKFEFLSSSNGGKLDIGNEPISPTEFDPQSFTVLPYATWIDGTAKGTETFRVRISEVSLTTVGVAPTTLRSMVLYVSIDVAALAPDDTPVAFTYKVTSFDGAKISTNFFPASGLAAGQVAPLVLEGAGFAESGITDPFAENGTEKFVPGPASLTAEGYNVITWDARGTFDSGGIMQFGNPFYEGRDVSEVLTWASQYTPALLNGANDPAVGMVGTSYGGAIQLTTAATDPRVDAIVPGQAWNSLDSALSHNGIFRSDVGRWLLSPLKSVGARLNQNIQSGISEGITSGRLSSSTRAALASIGPSILLQQLQAPTLLLQSTIGSFATLSQSIDNAQTIIGNPFGTPLKMFWFDATDVNNSVINSSIQDTTILWLNKYVMGLPIPDLAIPTFRWIDQEGNDYTSLLLPFDSSFNSLSPLTVTNAGGSIDVAPYVGAGSAVSQIRVRARLSANNKVVGAPSLAFSYKGTGDAHAVFAQVVDKSSGKVVGRIVTPIPVWLDGRQRTISISLADIVYSRSSSTNAVLEIQILGSAPGFSQQGTGKISITNISVDIPIAN